MIVLDTHVLIWWVNGEVSKLSRKAVRALTHHGRRNELLVPTISIFEIASLARRDRIRLIGSVGDWLSQLRRLPEYRIEPLTDDIAQRAGQLGDSFPGDPADRIIAATALERGAPLITQDEMLRAAGLLSTIW